VVRVLVATLVITTGASAQTLRFHLVPRDAVEGRLREYGGPNAAREATLVRMFRDAGCGEHLSEQPVKHAKTPNVICVLVGTGEQVILVGAHYDRVPTSDGVADNWSGASLLPSLYESMKVQPRQHTFVFVGFTDEERGLVGSNFYAHQMTRAQVAATRAMINLDTLGLASTEVWAHRADPRLTKALQLMAFHLKMPLMGVNFERAGYSTDSESFKPLKIPRITIHSLTQRSEDLGILHTSKDKLSAMNLDQYYDTYRLVAVYLAYLDFYFGAPDSAEPGPS